MSADELDRLFADIPDPVRDSGAGSPSDGSFELGASGRGKRAFGPEPQPPSDPAPTREQSAQRRWVAAALGVSWAVAFAFVLGVRADVLHAQVLAQILVWTLTLPLGLSLALRPLKTGWPRGVVAQRLGLTALAATFVGLSLLPAEGVEVPLSFKTVRGCLSLALLIGLPSLLGAALVLKRSLLNAPALRGAVVGAVCGMAGAVGIHTHCPRVTSSHVLLAHGLPILLFAGLGVLFGVRRGRV
jgi:hypothetical protein